jgi:putative membrane protein
MPPRPEKPGLQAERTQLSWERTAISFLVAGALPLFGRGPLDDGRIALPVVGALLAVLVVWLARRRAHRFTVAAKAEIVLLGCATAGFAGLILMIGAFE